MSSHTYLFLSGQISVLETQLLRKGQLDRMVGASSAKEAFGVLTELAYAQYFDESLSETEFMRVLSQGLLETKQFLDDSLGAVKARALLWLGFDLNNLKRAAKDYFLWKKESLEDFTEDNGYIPWGNLSKEDLEKIIFSKEDHASLLPKEFQKVWERYQDKNDKDFVTKDFERDLDEAYLQSFRRLSRSGGAGMQWYATLIEHDYHLRKSIREAFDQDEEAGWKQCQKAFARAEDFVLLEKVPASLPLEQKLVTLEQLLDQSLHQKLQEAAQGSDGFLKAYAYFQRRWYDARQIKVIMLGKFYGQNVEDIERQLAHLTHLS